MATHYACFDTSLHGPEVTVHYTFPTNDPRDVEVVRVVYNGVNILRVLHDEDAALLRDRAVMNAPEALEEERATAAEFHREARYA